MRAAWPSIILTVFTAVIMANLSLKYGINAHLLDIDAKKETGLPHCEGDPDAV